MRWKIACGVRIFLFSPINLAFGLLCEAPFGLFKFSLIYFRYTTGEFVVVAYEGVKHLIGYVVESSESVRPASFLAACFPRLIRTTFATAICLCSANVNVLFIILMALIF